MSRFFVGLGACFLLVLGIVVWADRPGTVQAGGGPETPTATSTPTGAIITVVATCAGPHDRWPTSHVDLEVTLSGSATTTAGEGFWTKITNQLDGRSAHYQFMSTFGNDRSQFHDVVNSIRWEGDIKLVPGRSYKISVVRAPYSETGIPAAEALVAVDIFYVTCSFPTPTATPTPVSLPTLPSDIVGLHAGWNLVAFPEAAAYGRVSSLTTNMVKQYVDVWQVARWQDGRWESYIPGFSVNDFQLDPRRGYFFRVARDAHWNPSFQLTAMAVKKS